MHRGQVALSRRIKRKLNKEVVTDELSELVAGFLPDHASYQSYFPFGPNR